MSTPLRTDRAPTGPAATSPIRCGSSKRAKSCTSSRSAVRIATGTETCSPPASEVGWLAPYPDRLLGEITDAGDGPHETIVARETIEFAFLVAIQHLPPRPHRLELTVMTHNQAAIGLFPRGRRDRGGTTRRTPSRHRPHRRAVDGQTTSVTLNGAAGAFRRFEKRQCEAAQTARRSRSDAELVDRRPRLPGSGWPIPGDDDDGIPRTSRSVRYQGNAASRAHPAGGRLKLPPMAGNPRNTKSGTPC
jgi:hypothetical protein